MGFWGDYPSANNPRSWCIHQSWINFKYRSKPTTPECIYGQQIAMMDIATHGRFHETQKPTWPGAGDGRMPVFHQRVSNMCDWGTGWTGNIRIISSFLHMRSTTWFPTIDSAPIIWRSGHLFLHPRTEGCRKMKLSDLSQSHQPDWKIATTFRSLDDFLMVTNESLTHLRVTKIRRQNHPQHVIIPS